MTVSSTSGEDPTLEEIVQDCDLAERIYQYLHNKDLLELATVNPAFYHSVRYHQSRRTIELTIESIDKLEDQGRTIEQAIREDFPFAVNLEINGWSSGKYVEDHVYDDLFNSKLKARRLTIYNRGEWSTCKCPTTKSRCGELFDSVKSNDLTNFEYIQIASQFRITSCAFLDLISRSPKLKELRFYGILQRCGHHENFENKTFHCDLERIYWPWPSKKYLPTISLLAKRNDRISHLYSNIETVCYLLSADALPNIKSLALILNENWDLKKDSQKKAYEYIQRINYLGLAKNLEALEVRTFGLDLNEDIAEEEATSIEQSFENYQLIFWEHVAKLSKLRYLAVFGSWELGQTCRELAKHGIPIEYLKINLVPSSILDASGDEKMIFSIDDEAKHLRKLPKLRSLDYICTDQLDNISNSTAAAFRDLIDLIYMLQIKVVFTDEVEELLNSFVKRGSQIGKTYKVTLMIQTGNVAYVNSVTSIELKPSKGQRLRDTFIAEVKKYLSKYKRGIPSDGLFVWGLETSASTRDNETFQTIKSAWDKYKELFRPSFMFV